MSIRQSLPQDGFKRSRESILEEALSNVLQQLYQLDGLTPEPGDLKDVIKIAEEGLKR